MNGYIDHRSLPSLTQSTLNVFSRQDSFRSIFYQTHSIITYVQFPGVVVMVLLGLLAFVCLFAVGLRCRSDA